MLCICKFCKFVVVRHNDNELLIKKNCITALFSSKNGCFLNYESDFNAAHMVNNCNKARKVCFKKLLANISKIIFSRTDIFITTYSFLNHQQNQKKSNRSMNFV